MQTIEFELEGGYVELNMLLKLVGLCDSGGAGKATAGVWEGSHGLEWQLPSPPPHHTWETPPEVR